ncbi:MAG: SRPBCC family protein [Chloroflexi bacterium]|nr:SRPBCC family protein [Chloroflexota bacterium]
MRINRSVETSAAADRVWRVLVDEEKIPEWCLPAKKLRITSEQKSGLGTAFYFEEQAGGQLLKLNLKVTEWVKNKVVAFEMASGNFIKGYEQTYRIEATSSGSRIIFTENIRLPYGVLGKIAGILVRFRSEARVKAMLFNLVTMAEG